METQIKQTRPLCEHPVIILNRAVYTQLPFIDRWYLNGQEYGGNMTTEQYDAQFTRQFRRSGNTWYYRGRPLSIELMNKYYVRTNTNQYLPIFLAVPCGKCIICRDKKIKEFVGRVGCDMETFDTGVKLFVTLTYANEHLPATGLVDPLEIRMFMVRLRLYLERYYKRKKIDYPVNSLRWAACGEYGTRRGRPHYHIMLWNLPRVHDADIYNLLTYKRIIHKAWLYKCQWQALRVEFPKNETKSVRYIAKYMAKSVVSNDPEKCPFVRWCRGSKDTKGLGKKWIEQMRPYVYSNIGNPNFKLWLRNGSSCPLCRFYVDTLFPSFSKIFDKEQRDNWLNEWDYCQRLSYTRADEANMLEFEKYAELKEKRRQALMLVQGECTPEDIAALVLRLRKKYGEVIERDGQ